MVAGEFQSIYARIDTVVLYTINGQRKKSGNNSSV